MAVVAGSVLAGSADVAGFRDVATKARTEYVAAKVKLQADLADLITRMEPAFEPIATAERDFQLALIQQRTAQFNFLLDHDPNQILLTNGLSKFANFDWTADNGKALERADPDYAAFTQRIVALKQKNGNQSDWLKFRAWFRDTLSKNKEYETIMNDFMAKQKDVEIVLKRATSK